MGVELNITLCLSIIEAFKFYGIELSQIPAYVIYLLKKILTY